MTGRVLDSSTGVPVGRVEVWLISEETGQTETIEADGGGRFLFTPVEPGDYSLRAIFRGFGEARTPVTVEADRTATQDLSLVFQDPNRRTGILEGTVVAAEDGEPISGARVVLDKDDLVRTSGDNGSFMFSKVSAGAVTVTASMLGYGDAEGSVVVGGGQTVQIEVRLSPRPIELEPIVVEATRLEIDGVLADVQRRAERGWGTVLMSEQLEPRRSVTRTTDILQEYGASVVGSTESQRGLYFRRTGCAPVVYIDGIRATSGSRSRSVIGSGGEVDAAQAVNLVHPLNIEAMEIYRGPAQVPGEFLDSNAQCGVILIWTKRGG